MEDHKTPLYPKCKGGHKKLRSTLELLQWKAANGISDKAFTQLLKLIKEFLPEGNKLPENTYKAKEVVCPIGLEVQKIHACPNDCILYRGNELEDLEACPVCNASRYKIRRNDSVDVDGEPPRKRVPAKEDDVLRHPADRLQWRKVDRMYPQFAEDARNIRFGLSTNGMNPFSEMSSSHSTWPVTLYVQPTSIAMLKAEVHYVPALIQGLKQPGNDIDVYLQPLVDELLELWTTGVCMWDEYKQEDFDLHAMLFVTINDWPALSNLLVQSNKGFRACTHCLDETDSMFLKHCRKVVYMGNRRFLLSKHLLRKKGKHYAQADHRNKPIHRDGKMGSLWEGICSQPVSNEDGKAPMWRRILDVRHAIDVMHLTKNLCVNLLGFLGTYGKDKDTLESLRDMEAMNEK
ncbi:hypothetical protein U9M48_003777, partial [Paspalum notatum var. saurae]